MMRTALLVLVVGTTSGCYIEARGGAVAMTGGNEPWRGAPMIGVATGFVLDVGAGRFAVGAGGDGSLTRYAGSRQYVVSGPFDIQATARSFSRSPADNARGAFGVTLGATTTATWGSGMRLSDKGGVIEGRRYSGALLFTGITYSKYLDTLTSGVPVILDLALGPAVPLALGQEGTTNVFGIGIEGRVSLSFPLTMSDAMAATRAIEQAGKKADDVKDLPTHALDEETELLQVKRIREGCIAAQNHCKDDCVPAPQCNPIPSEQGVRDKWDRIRKQELEERLRQKGR